MITAMVGLPASGKSTIARPLAASLSAIILDKDQIRASLFQRSDIEYSREQDDFCMHILFQLAGYLVAKNSARHIIMDGRPFGRWYQFEALKEAMQKLAIPVRVTIFPCFLKRLAILCATVKGSQRQKKSVASSLKRLVN